ncbi:hypothetical protein H4R34_001528 [Dimargaris verticillata]|uniref:Sodium/potassium exporting P-type ATPase 1 n=1 Tax=Dimargaris verticillata TaxID=2761393 RepID=A0A9W8EAU8_9FUNG|nr:hypothetical protein H4R34_001528 [Dimargaris verticillata]
MRNPFSYIRLRRQAAQVSLPPYHTYTTEVVAKELATNIHDGLTSTAVQENTQTHGANEIKGQGGVSAYKVLFRQIANALTVVLMAALVVSFVVKDWVEGGVIAFIVILNVSIGFFQEYRAEKTMDSLRKMASPSARVVRDGDLVTIPTSELTVGDILVVENGDVVGADCRFFEVSNLEIDEALLTGESMPVPKTVEALQNPDQPLGDRTNMGFSSTTVTKGRGRGIVTGIGMMTEIGKIAKTLMDTKDSQKTPLQRGLDYMAYVLFALAVIFVLVVFGASKFNITGDVAIYAIALAIAFVPEGLIAVVTITMAVGVYRMAKNRALVRKLNALEALGSVTNICSDKTGTLTQSRMVLRRAWLPQADNYQISGTGFTPRGDLFKITVHSDPSSEDGSNDSDEQVDGGEVKNIRFADELSSKELVELANMDFTMVQFALCASLCNMSDLKQDEETKQWNGIGDPTEIALQVFAHKLEMDKPRFTSAKNDDDLPCKLLAEFPFESAIKRMSVVYRIDTAKLSSIHANHGLSTLPMTVESEGIQPVTTERVVCYLKGATERTLPCCGYIYEDGQVVPLTEQHQETIMAQVADLAMQGLRVLTLAYRPLDDPATTLPGEPTKWQRESVDQDMIFLGLAGIYDPPRPESWPSVQECYDAGIGVHMLTGDHPATAAAIAREIGLLPYDLPLKYATRPLTINSPSPDNISIAPNQQLVMTAQQFDNMTDQEIDDLPELPHVIARCSPDTKVKMIEALHRRRGIVAMTGDGVNDSPSLKIANIGIAMGQQGSDVAKQAAHIVLTDDNFATIVKAIAEGRRIFSNIQKFIVHMVSANVAEVVPLLIGLAFIDDSGTSVFPMAPVQILFNNLLTSSPPAMALGMEKMTAATMKRAPRPLKSGIFTWETVTDILIYGGIAGIISIVNFVLVVYAFGSGELGVDCNSTYSDSCDDVFRARGTLFTTLTYILLLHAYNCRDPRNPQWWGWWKELGFVEGFKEYFLSNRYLAWSIGIECLTIFPVLYIPTLNTVVFKHKSISWEWGIVVISIILFLVFSELYKLAKRTFLKPLHLEPTIPLSRMTTTVSIHEDRSTGQAPIDLKLSGQVYDPYAKMKDAGADGSASEKTGANGDTNPLLRKNSTEVSPDESNANTFSVEVKP